MICDFIEYNIGMKSLYRRYRPTKLAEVIGQPQVTEPLIKALEQGRINHAYLFIGPRGCGKTSVARILAHEVNGFNYQIEDDYVDIIEIDGASNRGIDNIRELREKVAIAPTSGKYKVYIIDEVHMLTKEAFNALLKTLEEPPTHAIFIMATTDAYKVPVTITSRAQTYTFKLADEKVMFDFLKSVVKKEKITIADDALMVIARRGGGSFRDSLSLLDQISTLSDKEITKEMVVSAMGLPQDEKITELLNRYTDHNLDQITACLKELLCSGVKAETLSEEMIAKIIREPKPELLPLLAKLPDVKAPYAEAKLLVALTLNESLSSDGRPLAQSFSQHFTQSSTRSSRQLARAEHSLGDFTRLGQGNVSKNDIGSGGELSENKDSFKAKSLDTLSSSTFDWTTFTQKVQELNDAVYSQLIKCEYKFSNGSLSIYPKKKIAKNILSRDNNKKILFEAIGADVKITICEENETPSAPQTDGTLAQISAIMGGEVISDAGGNPF